jgi:hypothetical protein
MKSLLPGVCPLCGGSFPRGQLHLHIIAEPPGLRHNIMAKIRSSHPGWSHELGACPGCWESYRKSPGAAAAMTSTHPMELHLPSERGECV